MTMHELHLVIWPEGMRETQYVLLRTLAWDEGGARFDTSTPRVALSQSASGTILYD